MLESLSQRVADHLIKQGLVLATAESCTGGWVAKLMTDIAGSSTYFDRGFVTYTNESKQDMLSVKESTLIQHGAVSEATVTEMANGALLYSLANTAVAISGIAGPTGGTVEKPVGTVCFAWQRQAQQAQTATHYFVGNRDSVRQQAVEFILLQLLKF